MASQVVRGVRRSAFGPAFKYTLVNASGASVVVTNYGATVLSIQVPDKEGKLEEVTVQRWSEARSDLDKLKSNPCFYGATCGRFANRIAKGRFTLDGVEYQLPINNGVNSLHGGEGYDKAFWVEEQGKEKEEKDGEGKEMEETSVSFSHRSPAGDQGYPGELDVRVKYSWSDENELAITLTAQLVGGNTDGVAAASTPAATVVNLTNHTYFNLGNGGDARADIRGSHRLRLRCPNFLPVDETQIPTGEVESVKDSAMDFYNVPKSEDPKAAFEAWPGRILGARLSEVDGGGKAGYDHCFCREGWETGMREDGAALAETAAAASNNEVAEIARLEDTVSGRVLRVLTNQDGVQVYTGNWMDGEGVHGQYGGVALECQRFPDAPNKEGKFPSAVLRAGEVYVNEILYAFSVAK